MTSASLRKKEAVFARRLRKASSKLSNRLEEELRADALRNCGVVEGIQDRAVRELDMQASTVESQLDHFAGTACKAEQSQRQFQADQRVTRPLKTPDILKSLFLLTIGWVVEIVFAATGLFADGHVDLIPALGFATVFATANIGLGLATGFTLQFVNYRCNSVMWSLPDLWVRWIARVGLILLLVVSVIMIFVGGRVRVTGGHDGIFDFHALPFAQTFNDGLALVIMVIAALSVALAATKGYSGFVDPIPGYADHVGAALSVADEAQDVADDVLDAVEDIVDQAEDDILDAGADPQARAKLLADITRHNGRIDAAIAEYAVFAQDEWQRNSFVAGEDLPKPEIETPLLDALRIDASALNASEVVPEPMERLRIARTEANARVSTAYTAFLAKLSSFRTPNPTANT